MTALRTFVMILGALAVLMVGVVSATAEVTPPCHDAMSSHSSPAAPSPDEPIKSMACCVACVAPPKLDPPARTTIVLKPDALSAAPTLLPPGRSDVPAHGPPRLHDA